MPLDRIILNDFRNHRETRIEGTRRFNLLVGENGAGKTNVLEAISLFAPGRGMRRARLDEMSGQDGAGGFVLSAQLITNGEPVRLGTGIAVDQPGKRIVQVNGAPAPAVRLGEWLSIGWLTPTMDRLFSEGASGRRRFLDRLVLAVLPEHARHAARLENAVRERNRLLADVRTPEAEWLDAVEAQIAAAGAQVASAREQMIMALQEALDMMPDGPFARPAISYAPGGPVLQAEMLEALRANRAQDLAARRTLCGPHRDEMAVRLAGKDQAAAECSTGEQKAMLIAIVLAHSLLLQSDGETRPRLLLLDEVAAHLDPIRREALFARLREGAAQVWLTGTELAPFEAILKEAAVWQVREGTISRLD